MSSIAFFDVDNTLVKGNTGYYTSLLLVRYGIMKQRRFLQAGYYYLSSFLFSQNIEKIYKIAIADLAGATLDHVLKIGQECFERDIKPRIFKEGLERIKEHRKKGHLIVLLTAAPYMLVHAFNNFVNADEAYAMGPEVIGGVLTNRLQQPLCHGVGKVHYAKMAAKKYGVRLQDCYFYTDDHSDIPLLEKIGYPEVINPTRRLRNHALIRGWPVSCFTHRGV